MPACGPERSLRPAVLWPKACAASQAGGYSHGNSAALGDAPPDLLLEWQESLRTRRSV